MIFQELRLTFIPYMMIIFCAGLFHIVNLGWGRESKDLKLNNGPFDKSLNLSLAVRVEQLSSSVEATDAVTK